MSPSASLDLILKDLPSRGTLVKDRGYRQIWRLAHEGKTYYLKFYPRAGSFLKRLFRGSPAMREFLRLQQLQKAGIPAARAVGVLMGFRLNDAIGDLVVVDAVEPAISLDVFLNELKLRGEPIPDHLELGRQIRDLVASLARANLGHNDLHLGNILLHDKRLVLLDGYAVRLGGLRLDDLLMLGHSVNRYANRTDLLRGWEQLGPGGPLPAKNPVGARQIRKFLERIHGENPYFGKIETDGWTGVYFKRSKYPRRWAPASRLESTAADWQRVWPLLLSQMQSDQLTPLKRSPSGDVWAGEVVVAGRPISIVAKRPYKRYWYRYINEIGRGNRARRAWFKAWNLVARNIPTAWPLLLMEKRSWGYVTDCVVVFENVAGPTLADVDLESLDESGGGEEIGGPSATLDGSRMAIEDSAIQDAARHGSGRDKLFRRTGRILRQIERQGFAHFDAKASNWIVQADEISGPRPILIDVDGIRHRQWTALGFRRLLRSMQSHPQFTAEDSLALCHGYAPFSPMKIRRVPADAEPLADGGNDGDSPIDIDAGMQGPADAGRHTRSEEDAPASSSSSPVPAPESRGSESRQ